MNIYGNALPRDPETNVLLPLTTLEQAKDAYNAFTKTGSGAARGLVLDWLLENHADACEKYLPFLPTHDSHLGMVFSEVTAQP